MPPTPQLHRLVMSRQDITSADRILILRVASRTPIYDRLPPPQETWSASALNRLERTVVRSTQRCRLYELSGIDLHTGREYNTICVAKLDLIEALFQLGAKPIALRRARLPEGNPNINEAVLAIQTSQLVTRDFVRSHLTLLMPELVTGDATPTPQQPKEKVYCYGAWSTGGQTTPFKGFKDVTEDVLEKWPHKVAFINCHGRPRHYDKDTSVKNAGKKEDLKILLWSAPDIKEDIQTGSEIWGYTPGCQDGRRLPGKGVAIQADDVIIAEFYPSHNVLYIAYDICHRTKTKTVDGKLVDCDLAIFRIILEEVADFLLEDVNAPPDELFAKNITKLKKFKLRRLKDKHTALIKAMHVQRTRLKTISLNLEHTGREISILTKEHGGEVELLRREYNKIVQHPKVLRVVVKNGYMSVFTTHLICTEPKEDKRYHIGKFHIKVDMTGALGDIKFFNMTQQIHGHQAPHIFEEGDPCYGSIQEAMTQLAENALYSDMIGLAIAYICTANIEDSEGRKVVDWPRYNKDDDGVSLDEKDKQNEERETKKQNKVLKDSGVATFVTEGTTTEEEADQAMRLR